MVFSGFSSPLEVSKTLLQLLGIRVNLHNAERIPAAAPLVVVSNHRSFLDAPLLMAGVNRSVRFACHHYMSQVPGMREFVTAMGCLPLDAPGDRRYSFFQRASHLLEAHQAIGIFPEGATPMVQTPRPREITEFERGFAHLALRAPVPELTILPVAIISRAEASSPVVPLKLLSYFDPSEPLFDQRGWHPAVIYRQVDLRVGYPVRVTEQLRSHYQGRAAAQLAEEVTQCCQNEIANLMGRAS